MTGLNNNSVQLLQKFVGTYVVQDMPSLVINALVTMLACNCEVAAAAVCDPKLDRHQAHSLTVFVDGLGSSETKLEKATSIQTFDVAGLRAPVNTTISLLLEVAYMSVYTSNKKDFALVEPPSINPSINMT